MNETIEELAARISYLGVSLFWLVPLLIAVISEPLVDGSKRAAGDPRRSRRGYCCMSREPIPPIDGFTAGSN